MKYKNTKVSNPEARPKLFNVLAVNSAEGWDERLTSKLADKFTSDGDGVIETTYSELWGMIGNIGTVQTKKIEKFIDRLVKGFSYIKNPLEYKDPNNGKEYEFSGTVFSVVKEKPNGLSDEYKSIKIAISPLLKDFLLSSRQKEILYNIKEADKLGYTQKEIEETNIKFREHVSLLGGEDQDKLKGNKYAQRLYHILMELRNSDNKRWNRSIEGLRKDLMIPKSYVIGGIKQKIIEPSRKLLKEVGLNIIRIDYKKAKGSRSITSICFTFNYNTVKGYEIAVESITNKMMKNRSFLTDFKDVCINGTDKEYRELIRNEYVHSYNVSPEIYDTKEFNEKVATALLDMLEESLNKYKELTGVEITDLKPLIYEKKENTEDNLFAHGQNNLVPDLDKLGETLKVTDLKKEEKKLSDYTDKQVLAAIKKCVDEEGSNEKLLLSQLEHSPRKLMESIKKYL